MTGQKFLQWSDDIKPNDDITPFDGTLSSVAEPWHFDVDLDPRIHAFD
jgi:hypothetical protein